MAFMGTVVIYDFTINYRVIEGGLVTYTVAEGRFGEEETITVDAKKFFLALGVANSADGELEAFNNAEYSDLESVMPLSTNLRFIP